MLGFILIMKQLSDRVGGNISSYQLAGFWPLTRDYLENERGCNKIFEHDDHSFLQNCRHVLGTESIRQYFNYRNALLGSSPFPECYMLIISLAEKRLRTLKQNLIVEAANELNGKICHRKRFSLTSLFGQIRNDINSLKVRELEKKMEEGN